MFRLAADVQVYLHREPIDFGAGINSLAVRALPCRICPIAYPSILDWRMHHQMPGPNT